MSIFSFKLCIDGGQEGLSWKHGICTLLFYLQSMKITKVLRKGLSNIIYRLAETLLLSL